MGRGEDRISFLPDPILQTILTMMPLKSAIRTDVLSKRWRNLWQYSLFQTTSLEFNEDLATNLSAKDFVDTVNRYLSLNNCEKLERFHVFFCPFVLFAPDIQRWVSFAAGKGVRHLDVDLSQGFRDPKYGFFTDDRSPVQLPFSLFDCDSLTDLSLSRCDFGLPLILDKFGGLQSLSLCYSNIEEATLRSVLTGCPLLKNLTLRSCQQLGVISLIHPGIKLRALTIGDCWSTNLLEIDAPELQSFHYFGGLCRESSFLNVSSLEEASITSIGRSFDHDYMELLLDLSGVQILTLCTATLVYLNRREEYDEDRFPIDLHNLNELQLLVDSMTNEYLTCIFSFFDLCSCPSLEKLFIRLPENTEDPNVVKYDLVVNLNPQNPATMDNLNMIKVTNFKGSFSDMKLVSFFLQKAYGLETMDLVLPLAKKADGQERFLLKILRGQMSMHSKASPNAEIVVREFGEDDGLNPTHVEVYNDNSWLPVIPSMASALHLNDNGEV